MNNRSNMLLSNLSTNNMKGGSGTGMSSNQTIVGGHVGGGGTTSSNVNNMNNQHHQFYNYNHTSQQMLNNSLIMQPITTFINSMPNLAAAAASAAVSNAAAANNNLAAAAVAAHHHQQTSINSQMKNIPTSTIMNKSANSLLLNLVMCKLTTPHHLIQDPRLLECGSSACYQCIVATKDQDRNLKCYYCNGVHKIPSDAAGKLVVNKSLELILKNETKINFNKLMENSIFSIEQLVQNQNQTIESLEKSLNSIQADVINKLETYKSQLEKYFDQIRKEIHKLKFELNGFCQSKLDESLQQANNNNSLSFMSSGVGGNTIFNSTSTNLLSNQTNHLISNSNMSNINNSNKIISLLQQQSGDNAASNNNSSTGSLDLLNSFNYTNSSVWNSNDDLDNLDSDNISISKNSSKKHLNKEQAQFNKFVREEVAKRFGENYLMSNEVNQLESVTMEAIKHEAIATFLPKDTPPARAWTLAKVSLRSLKRDLRRKQGLLMTTSSSVVVNNAAAQSSSSSSSNNKKSSSKIMTSNPYYNI